MRSLLAEGGYLVASIPNLTHLSVVLELIRGRFLYRRLGLLDDTHLRFFCRETVDQLFQNAGYRITWWGRVVIPPELTEFQTDLESFPGQLIDYLKEQNPDYDTYQFVVRAERNENCAGTPVEEKTKPVTTGPPAENLLNGRWQKEAIAGLLERLRHRERLKDKELDGLKKRLQEKEKEIIRLKEIIAQLKQGAGN